MDSVNYRQQYAPFAQQYLQNNYTQNVPVNPLLPVQRPTHVLDQISGVYQKQEPFTQQMLHQQHSVTHPQPRDILHRDQPISVVSREEIESVWRVKCQQLERALAELQTEVMRLRGIGMSEKVTYVEDSLKINQLYLEIDRLNKCLLDLSLELDQQKKKLIQATDKSSRNYDNEADKVRQMMVENESIMNSEINRLRLQLDDSQKRQKMLEISLQEAKNTDGPNAEIQIGQLRAEIDRLNYQINHAKADTEEWRLKQQRTELQLREYANHELEIKRLNETIQSKNREIEQLRTANSIQQQQEIRFPQAAPVAVPNYDLERLQTQLRQRNEENEKLRNQVTTLEFKLADSSKYSNMDTQYRQMQSEHDSLIQQLKEARSLESKCSDLQNQLRSAKDELQHLQMENEELHQKIEELAQRNDDLEYSMQEDQSAKFQAEAERWQLKYKQQNTEFYKIQTKLMELEAENEILKRQKNEQKNVTVTSSRIMPSGPYDQPQYQQQL